MSNEILHPTPDRLEAYVEGSLSDADRAVLESHLVSCARCQTEVEEWRALFAALASLPLLEPSPGFADRVMAGVTVHRPWTVRVAELIRRLIPDTTKGWVLITAFLSLPMLVIGGSVAWLLTRPAITLQGLWFVLSGWLTEGVVALAGRVAALIAENTMLDSIWRGLTGLVATTGVLELGAVAAVFAVLTMLSTWILYRNLVRPPTRKETYVTYPF